VIDSRRTWSGWLARIVVVVALANRPLAAQASDGGVFLGPFAGVVFATLAGEDVSSFTSRTDFAAGLQFDQVFPGGVFIRSGLIYSGRGATAPSVIGDVVFKQRFVDLPVIVGYRLHTRGPRPFFFGGAQVGLNVGCELEDASGGSTTNINCDDSSGNFALADLNGVVGAGIAVPAGKAGLTLDVRYLIGLQQIEALIDGKNRALVIGGAYMFRIGSQR